MICFQQHYACCDNVYFFGTFTNITPRQSFVKKFYCADVIVLVLLESFPTPVRNGFDRKAGLVKLDNHQIELSMKVW